MAQCNVLSGRPCLLAVALAVLLTATSSGCGGSSIATRDLQPGTDGGAASSGSDATDGAGSGVTSPGEVGTDGGPVMAARPGGAALVGQIACGGDACDAMTQVCCFAGFPVESSCTPAANCNASSTS